MTESTGFVPLNANDFKSNKNKVDLGEIEVGGNEEQAESGFVRLADSKQPKDLFTQLDSTVRDMSEKFSKEPYMAAAYRSAIQGMPMVDEITKVQLAQGDTTNLKEAYGIPALHFANQYLFNYPRAMAAKMGYEFPEAESLPGQVLSKSAGVAGALTQFSAGTKLAGKVPGLAKTGGLGPAAKATVAGIETGIKKNTLRGIGQGAVAGGAQGFIQSPEDIGDFKARGQQAALGAVLGGILAPVSDKIGNFLRKRNIRKKTSLKGRTGRVRADKNLQKSLEDIESDTVIKEATALVDQSTKELQDAVGVQQVRGKVPELKAASIKHGKQVNKVYDHTVNRISREIEENTVSHGAVDWFDDFARQLDADEGLKNTAAAGRVRKFVNDVVEKGDTLEFKDVNNLRHGVVGGKQFKGDMDDVVYTMFRKSFNDWAEVVDTTGKFKALNKGMGPRLEFKADFNKKINTYKKYESGKGEEFIKKYANRNLEPEKITQGEIDLGDDMMKYLGKYGIKTDDVEAIYSKKAGDIAKTKGVSSKIKQSETVSKRLDKAVKAKKTNIRAKQDIKIDDIMNTKSKRLIRNSIDTVVRLTLAGAALNFFHEIKKGVGIGSSPIPNSQTVQ